MKIYNLLNKRIQEGFKLKEISLKPVSEGVLITLTIWDNQRMQDWSTHMKIGLVLVEHISNEVIAARLIAGMDDLFYKNGILYKAFKVIPM